MGSGPGRVAAALEIADAPEQIRVRVAFGWFLSSMADLGAAGTGPGAAAKPRR